jgi:hypothetical protein
MGKFIEMADGEFINLDMVERITKNSAPDRKTYQFLALFDGEWRRCSPTVSHLELGATLPNTNHDLVVVDYWQDDESADGISMCYRDIIGWAMYDAEPYAITLHGHPQYAISPPLVLNVKTHRWNANCDCWGESIDSMLDHIYDEVRFRRIYAPVGEYLAS